MTRLHTTQAETPPPSASLLTRIEAGLLEGSLELPVLPAAAMQILALTSNESVDAVRLAGLVQGDQALASHVLKVANSAAFAPRARIVSLQQAVTRMGTRMLGEIALSASVRSRVFRAPGFESKVRGLWRQALTSGVYAKEIARLRRQNVEIAFMCGLLHSVGSPVVLGLIDASCKPPGERPAAAEIETVLDRFSVRAGVLLAERWNLPAPVQTAIGFHQRPEEAVQHKEETRVTALASRLACWLLMSLGGETGTELAARRDAGLEELGSLPVLGHLNLYPDDLEDLLAHATAVMETVEAMTP